MSRHLVLLGIALLAAMVLTARPASAATRDTVPLWFKADITIAADGSVSALQWRKQDNMPAALVTRLESLVRSWQFQPGSLDGRPAETETTLTLRVEASKAEDGSIALTLANAVTGPTTASQAPPEYPRAALRRGASARLVLDVVLDVNGVVRSEMVKYISSDNSTRVREEFEASALAMVEQWELEPERVGGHPVPAHMRLPLSYCLGDNSWCQSHPLPPSGDATADAAVPQGVPVAVDSVAKLLTDVRAIEI